jgi:hypothetical protein
MIGMLWDVIKLFVYMLFGRQSPSVSNQAADDLTAQMEHPVDPNGRDFTHELDSHIREQQAMDRAVVLDGEDNWQAIQRGPDETELNSQIAINNAAEDRRRANLGLPARRLSATEQRIAEGNQRVTDIQRSRGLGGVNGESMQAINNALAGSIPSGDNTGLMYQGGQLHVNGIPVAVFDPDEVGRPDDTPFEQLTEAEQEEITAINTFALALRDRARLMLSEQNLAKITKHAEFLENVRQMLITETRRPINTTPQQHINLAHEHIASAAALERFAMEDSVKVEDMERKEPVPQV